MADRRVHTGRPGEHDIVRELARVDQSFASLRAEDRIDALLLTGPPSPWRARAPALVAAAVAVVVVVALVRGNDARVAALRATASPATTGTTPTAVVTAAPARPDVSANDTAATAPHRGPAASARGERHAANERIAVALAEEVRFVDVPLGELELRAPVVVDLTDVGMTVVEGRALLSTETGLRTLVAGDAIAWHVEPPPAAQRSTPAQTSSTAMAPATNAPRALGADGTHSSASDREIEAALARAHALQARGADAEAADVLAELLATSPPPRIADTVGFERALLLAKARDATDACAALAEHARRFPRSDNADNVAALRARLACP